ncbi:MAG: NUDIX hydrolase [Limisphaerales bacterium]
MLIVEGENILLVRQYRLLVNQLAWEIPGGKIEAGEKPEQAAIREALEETDLQCREVKSLRFSHPGLDSFENPTFIFYTNSFEKIASVSDAREVVESVWIPLPHILKMIFAGEIVESMTIIAVLAYHTMRQSPELVNS